MITVNSKVLRRQHEVTLAAARVTAPVSPGNYVAPHIYPKGSIPRGIAMEKDGSRYYVTIDGDFKVAIPDGRAIPRTKDMDTLQQAGFIEAIKKDIELVAQIKAHEKLKMIPLGL